MPGQSASIPPVVTWSLVTIGAWLIYTSVRGLSPVSELRAALTGSTSPGPQSLGVGVSPSVAAPTVDVGDVAPPNDSRAGSIAAPPADLVKIGQGNHQLAAATAQAFKAWEAAFGRTIPITDSYRTFEQQAKEHAKDPVRFAPATSSRHVRGQAVDVNLQQLGANAATNNQMWQALYSSATATGWCNPRGPYKGDHREPWHFSNPGCG